MKILTTITATTVGGRDGHELLGCFRCETCESWLYVTPRGNPESLRCLCNGISINLKSKPK